MFGLSKPIAYGIIILVSAALLLGIARWIYDQGVKNEQRAQIERSLGRVTDRNKDDEEIRNSGLDGLCHEYGAKRWLPEQNRCE